MTESQRIIEEGIRRESKARALPHWLQSNPPEPHEIDEITGEVLPPATPAEMIEEIETDIAGWDPVDSDTALTSS